MNWVIDDVGDLLTLLALAGLVIIFLYLVVMKRGSVSLTKQGLTVGKPNGKGTPTSTPKQDATMEQQHGAVMGAHTAQLDEIDDKLDKVLGGMTSLSQDMRTVYTVLLIFRPVMKTLIDKAAEKEMNGNIEEAYEALEKASKIVDDHMLQNIGGC